MVITRFKLKEVVNANGMTYSQAVLTVDRALTPEEQGVISKLSEQIKALATNVGFDEDGTHDGEGEMLNIAPETGEIIEPLK